MAAMLLLAVSCTKEVNVKLSDSSHEFEVGGGSFDLTVESNGAWQVGDCPSWLNITPMSGEGNATIVLTCSANTGSQERSAEIKVTTKTNEAILVVKQAFVEGNYIVFTPSTLNCDFQGGVYSISVEANCDWSIADLPSWIHCEPMSGSHSANIVMTIDRYSFSSEGNREYNVDFVADEQHFYFFVSQANDEAYHVIANPNSINFNADGGVETVTVQSIVSWTLACSADWISVTPESGDGNGEIAVTVMPNSEFISRNARIVFTSSMGSQSSVLVNQAAAVNPHYLMVNPTELLFPCEESSLNLSISTDSLWSVSCSEAWVSLSSDSGMGDATLTVTVSANTLLGNRRANLEVVSGSMAQIVTVTQANGATEPILEFNPDHFQLDCDFSLISVSISSNVAWSVRVFEEWMNPTINYGVGDSNIEFEVKKNYSPEPRVAYAYLSYQGVDYDTLVVEQEARVYYVESNVSELQASNQGDTFLVVVSANQDWSVASNSSWVNVEPNSGSGDGSFRLIVNANNTPAQRTAEVRISGSIAGLATIIVTQSN